MPENRQRKSRPQPVFAEYSRVRQILVVVVAPIVFGILAGLTLRWSAPAWWTMQVIGVLGAVNAGREHRLFRAAALRGTVAGLIAALIIVLVHALTTGADVANFSPMAFPVIAAVASAALHVGGTALRRRSAAPVGVDTAP